MIKQSGYYPLSLDISLGRIKLTDKALFAKTMALMLKSGVTISEALKIAEDSSSGRFKKILQKVGKSVQSGRSFSESLDGYPKVFSVLFVNTVRIGEVSGTLTENLENISMQLEKERALIAKIRGAALYPSVVLSAAFALGLVMVFFVLPKIVPLLESLKVDLPLPTRILIGLTHAIEERGFFILGIIIFIFVFLNWLLRQKFVRSVTHWLLLKIPIVRNITRGANLSRFCRTVGTLLGSGISIDETLDITANATENFYYRRAIKNVQRRIGKGAKLSESLSEYKTLFPRLVTRMTRAGEESGNMSQSFIYLADFYEEELDASTRSLSTTIEPLLLLIIGLIVAFLALSIITPIFQATGGIRG